MIARLIHLSLDHRTIVLVLAGLLLGFGALELSRRPVDILPDLNQPTVTVIAEVPGYAAEEVERLVTRPLEAALTGAPGVEGLRSESRDGLSLIRIEFAWASDIYLDRQLVQERLQLAQVELPPEVVPEMAPVSSITGEIMEIGVQSPDSSVDPMTLRTLADWEVRRRLLAVKGVAQVTVIGGDKQQFQVLADPDLLQRHRVSLLQVADAVGAATQNTSGSYLTQGNRELVVRNLGRIRDLADLRRVVVDGSRARPVLVADVARVQQGPALKRGDAAIDGRPAVLLMVFKQPGTNTLELTRALKQEVSAIRAQLPPGVALRADLYRQSTFLQRGVDNVIDALRDGSILVVIVLFLFLLNVRATVITLTALPLSFTAAGLAFAALDMTLNAMTLGGLAIAVGELVDDAIVGVENVVRHLRARPPNQPPAPIREVVAAASTEVRGPILTGTLVVVLVFLPLLSLGGLEGRLFAPLALAYIVAILASMVVSLTVTPVLAALLFGRRRPGPAAGEHRPPAAQRWLVRWASRAVTASLRRRRWVMAVTTAALGLALLGSLRLGTQFLPELEEGTVLVMTLLEPGTSLEESSRLAHEAERRLLGLPGVHAISRFTGRGEHDEHAPPVGISHLLLTLEPDAPPRDVMTARVRKRLAGLKGVQLNVGQPLSHRIEHLLSGVQAQVALKVRGEDLDALRRAAHQVYAAVGEVNGVTDLRVEPHQVVPQVHVALDRERLAEVGLAPGQLTRELGVALGGEVVGRVIDGERSFDLFVRLDEDARTSMAALRGLPVALPRGGWARLGDLAQVREGAGPFRISRDDQVRRIAVSCNVQGRSVGEVVSDLRQTLDQLQPQLPRGVDVRLEGTFAAQADATLRVVLFALLALGAIVVMLTGQLRSLNLALQVMAALPPAFAGGVALLLAMGQPFSMAALVGFVSLAGIATRNGILLTTRYRELVLDAGLSQEDAALRAGQERATPVVMTALTTGAGLLPLLLFAGETGRELLSPMATVIVGGLVASTLAEFLVRPALFRTLGRRWATGGEEESGG